jgi:molybdopterin converting factor small subunit
MTHVKVKLFASLMDYLPAGAIDYTAELKVPEDATVLSTIEVLRVPEEKCHLVLLNGIFVAPNARGRSTVAEGDTIAVWPPVAGG